MPFRQRAELPRWLCPRLAQKDRRLILAAHASALRPSALPATPCVSCHMLHSAASPSYVSQRGQAQRFTVYLVGEAGFGGADGNRTRV
jgi:hypothetical protein